MLTRTLPINEIEPGMVLCDAVLDAKGKILLTAGSVLSRKSIDLLDNWKIQQITIQIPADRAADAAEAGLATPLAPKREVFLSRYQATVTMASNLFQTVRLEKKVPVSDLQHTALQVYTTLTESEHAINYLLGTDRQAADAIAQHSVTVAYLSGLIARFMGLSDKEVKILTLSGLVHDIGKLQLPPGLLTKKTAYTREETELLKSHVAKGYALLKDTLGIPQEVLLATFQHHECMDGSGYPMGVTGKRIHPYAMIIKAANQFYNETYQDGQAANPFPVIMKLSREMFDKHDPTVIHPFLRQIRASLLSNPVMLSDGRQADIIFFHQDNYAAPLIKTQDGELIDLSTAGHLKIEKICTSTMLSDLAAAADLSV